LWKEVAVSIVRVGLSETRNFAEGYDAIFSKKKSPQKKATAGARQQLGKKKAKRSKKR
jgi:hypothetical protein